MHSKETVWYICHHFVSTGKRLYYKREMLTTDSYRNLNSIYWSAPKPVSRRTFERAKKLGYKCDVIRHYDPPAEVIPFDSGSRKGVRRRGTKRRTGPHRRGRSGSAIARFLLRWRV